jgi:hypothetical protein
MTGWQLFATAGFVGLAGLGGFCLYLWAREIVSK